MIKRTIYFGNPVRLSLANRQLVCTFPEGPREKVTLPIEDLGVVVLDHQQITITHQAIAAMLDNCVALVTCDSHHLPAGLLLPLSGNLLQSERFNAQVNSSVPLRKQLWQQTIQSKIRNQAKALQRLRHIDLRPMMRWAADVRSGDADNLEGRAAAYYWRALYGELIPDFVRDREGVPPNNLLNYGYAIVRAMTARALVAAGLLPTLGIHHHNRYNAYCLADDIMEPYRPYVDVTVDQMRDPDGEEQFPLLLPEIKRQLLSLTTQEVMIGGKRRPMMVAIDVTAKSLMKCYSGEARSILYPEM